MLLVSIPHNRPFGRRDERASFACSQILEFLGEEADHSLSSQKSQKLSTRRKTSMVSEAMSSTVRPIQGGADAAGWHFSRVFEVARKICWEIAHSLTPHDLYKWVHANRNDDTKMAALFTFSAW